MRIMDWSSDVCSSDLDILPTRIPDIAVGFMGPIPAPKLLYAWADKIKAITTRNHTKYRDVYDIWFLMRKMDALPDGAEDRDAIARVASLYDHTLASEIGRAHLSTPVTHAHTI